MRGIENEEGEGEENFFMVSSLRYTRNLRIQECSPRDLAVYL